MQKVTAQRLQAMQSGVCSVIKNPIDNRRTITVDCPTPVGDRGEHVVYYFPRKEVFGWSSDPIAFTVYLETGGVSVFPWAHVMCIKFCPEHEDPPREVSPSAPPVAEVEKPSE